MVPEKKAIKIESAIDWINENNVRSSVDNIENQKWLESGWFIAFSNTKNEFEKYIYFE